MQNDDSKKESKPEEVSHSRNTPMAKIGHYESLLSARKAIYEAMRLNPKLSAAELAEVLMGNQEREYVPALYPILERDFYIRAIGVARRQEAKATRTQLLLPGFEHLPLHIPGSKGKPILLIDASFSRVRAYYRSLLKSHVSRKRNDPKIKEAQKLMETMRKRSRTKKAITVGEVLLLNR